MSIYRLALSKADTDELARVGDAIESPYGERLKILALGGKKVLLEDMNGDRWVWARPRLEKGGWSAASVKR